MAIYDSAAAYIATAKNPIDKIAKINLIIEALLDTALKSATNDNITSYSLDDGQTKIHTEYKGTHAVLNSIKEFEKIKETIQAVYANQINGRVIRLVDSKNFIR